MTRIIADSTVDTFTLEGVDFVSVPLTISTKDFSYTDNEHLNVEEMLDKLASYNGRSFTSCPPVDSWLEAYAGDDEIYVVTLTSGLSGTSNAAETAARLYCEQNPSAKVHVFDTRSAGPSLRLVVDYLRDAVLAGKDFDTICAEATEYMRSSKILFALESFHNFAQNGRVSKLAVTAAGILGIRVLATATPEGVIDIIAKARGESRAVKAFLENMLGMGYCGGKIYISHCDAERFSAAVCAAIRSQFPNAEIISYRGHGLCSYYAERGGFLLAFEA